MIFENHQILHWIKKTGLPIGAGILDLGCGQGQMVQILGAEGFHAVGLDCRQNHVPEYCGDMRAIPEEDEAWDMVLAMCSLSVCGGVPQALKEIHRVLRPGGMAIISDLYALEGRHSALPKAEEWKMMVAQAGFTLWGEEDLTSVFRTWVLRSIWQGERLCNEGLPSGVRLSELGYGILILNKNE